MATGIKENYFDYALFYNNITCLSDINCSGLSLFNLNYTSSTIFNNLNNLSTNTGFITPNNISLSGANPTYALGGGSLIGYCNTVPTTLSTSAMIGDSIIRSANGNKLILQSGAGSNALYIDQYNNVVLDNPTTCLSTLNVSGITTMQGATTCLSSLNVSGITTMQGATTCLSTLNISGTTNIKGVTSCLSLLNISGATICNSTLTVNNISLFNSNVGMGGFGSAQYPLEINNSSYTTPLLCIDSGVYGGSGQNPRAIGKPLMKIGKSAWTGAGDYYGIGYGYAIGTTGCCCCEIGCVITNSSGGEVGDLLFSTRNSTTASTPATERMQINQ